MGQCSRCMIENWMRRDGRENYLEIRSSKKSAGGIFLVAYDIYRKTDEDKPGLLEIEGQKYTSVATVFSDDHSLDDDCYYSDVEYSKGWGYPKLIVMEREPLTHHLKTVNPFFMKVEKKLKTAEYRRLDRDIRVEDFLILDEYDRENNILSGREIKVLVTDILTNDAFPDMRKGWGMISFWEISRNFG